MNFKKLLFIPLVLIVNQASASEEWDWDITGAINETYDDNITFSHDNTKDDFITNLLVGVGVGQEAKTQKIKVEGVISQQLYQDNTSFNNTAQDFLFDFSKEITAYDRIALSDTFRHAEEPRSFDDEFGRTGGRYAFYRNRFDLNYDKDFSKQLTLKTHYTNVTYNASREDLSDSVKNELGGDLNYLYTTSTIFLFGYDIERRDFDPGTTFYVHSFLPGIRQYFTEQLYLEARAGAGIIDRESGENQTKSKFSFTLVDNINEETSASLSYKKDNSPAADQSEVFDSWKISADLKRQLLERLTVQVSAFYGEGEYTISNIHDQLTGASLGLNYSVTKNVKAFTSYKFTETDSNADPRSYRKNLVQAGVEVEF